MERTHGPVESFNEGRDGAVEHLTDDYLQSFVSFSYIESDEYVDVSVHSADSDGLGPDEDPHLFFLAQHIDMVARYYGLPPTRVAAAAIKLQRDLDETATDVDPGDLSETPAEAERRANEDREGDR